MKRILYLCMIFRGLSACSDAKVEPAGVTMEVRNYVEQKMYTFGYEQGIYLWSAKKWSDNGESHVRYIVDEAFLDAYNAREGKSLKLLPESCYRIEKLDFVVTDDDRIARFKVMCSPEKILELGGQVGKVEYALPVSIEVDGQRVEERYGSTIVGIEVEQPFLSIVGKQEEYYDASEDGGEEVDIEFPYSANFDNQWWINLNFTLNVQAVADYNLEHGTNYHVFPAQSVMWNKGECVLERLKAEGKVVFTVKVPKLPEGVSMLPIELTSASNGVMVETQKNRKYCFFEVVIPIAQTNWEVTGSAPWIGPITRLTDDVVSLDYSLSWVPAGETDVFYVTYKLKDQNKTAEVTGLRMHCFTNGGRGQKIADVYVSMDGATWDKVTSYEFVLENNRQKAVQKLIFDHPVPARYVKLDLNRKNVYDDYVGFSELYVLGSIRN